MRKAAVRETGIGEVVKRKAVTGIVLIGKTVM
jgi:hypothetical protein